MPSEQPQDDEPDGDVCPGNEHHTPDWNSVSVNIENDGIYFDVSCADCGRSGCLHKFNFKDTIQW